MRKFSLVSILCCVAHAPMAAVYAAGVPQPKLLTTGEVLQKIEQPATDGSKSAPATDAARLLADIREFRAGSSKLAPGQAAARWFALFDRARGVGSAAEMDFSAYDLETMRV